MKNPLKSIASWSSEAKAGLALSLGAVVIFVSAVALSNGGSSSVSSNSITNSSMTTTSVVVSPSSPSTPIVDVMLEEFIKPFEGDVSLKRCFYNAEDPIDVRKNAIIKVPGSTSKYIKSVGADYALDNGDSFNVIASLSGTVTDKMNDSMFGNVVVIEHKSGIKLYYASIENVKVNKGDEVKQGDIIATSGTSLYTTDLKSSLHFEVVKDEKHLDPEKVYSTCVKEI